MVVALQVSVFGQLSRERTAALYDMSGPQIVPGGAHEPNRVDTVMGIEALVLDGDQSPRHPRGNVSDGCIGSMHGGIIPANPGPQTIYRWSRLPRPCENSQREHHQRQHDSKTLTQL